MVDLEGSEERLMLSVHDSENSLNKCSMLFCSNLYSRDTVSCQGKLNLGYHNKEDILFTIGLC